MLRTKRPIICVVIEGRLIWAGHVARMGQRRAAYRVLVGKLKERDDFEDLDLMGLYYHGSLTIKMGACIGLIRLRIGI